MNAEEKDSTSSAAGPFADAPVRSSGERIGAYRLLRRLGQGGMGVVYEAEQQSPRRSVALKLIRGGNFVDSQQLKLFQREIQALGRLRHPGVAAIYEAGCTEDGQHFFAMELVRGETLSAYVTRRQADKTRSLSVKELLRLFLKVCDAVSYAHQRAVLHRDLKPSNIMVTQEAVSSEAGSERDGASIKMLDFGLARITDSDVAATTVVSEVGRIQGTLAYMSPEQVRGNPDEIDLRSDVYSLGVILYELIAGSLPYEISASAPLHLAVRAICEEPPRSLSGSVFARATSKGSSTSQAGIADRDLETIVMKALEKEPARRYQSVSALIGDVERYLADQPILARPASAAYQLRKLVVRHKAAAVFLATIFGLALTFSVAMAFQVRRTARERDRALQAEAQARTEAETAKRATEFMVELFKVSDPSEARGNSITAREVLDKGADRIAKELKDQPAVQATLEETIGTVYSNLGLHPQAQPLLESALETRKTVFGAESLEVAQSLYGLSELRHYQRKLADGLALAQDSLILRRRLLGADDPRSIASLDLVASNFVGMGRRAEAEPVAREVVERRRRTLGAEHPLLLQSIGHLGAVLTLLRKFDESETLLREALTGQRRVLGDEHPDTLLTYTALSNHFYLKADHAGAEQILRLHLPIRRKLLGDRHPQTLANMDMLAAILARRGNLAAAEELSQEALAVNEKGLGDRLPEYRGLLVTLANTRLSRGRFADAERVYRDLLSKDRAAGRSAAVASTTLSLARVLVKRGETVQAERLLRECRATFGEQKPAPAASLRIVLFELGELLSRAGRTQEAEGVYREGLGHAQAVLDDMRKRRPENWQGITQAERWVGGHYKGLRRYTDAEPLLLDSYSGMKRELGELDYRTQEVLADLIEMYGGWSKPDKAAEYRAMVPPPYKRLAAARE